jgi:acetolactate synthase-1/2/3 large subunit
MAHSENGAGYMAAGYARATGKSGVAMCQSIGTGNMAGGIYDAYLSNTPLIAITGKKVPTFQHKNAYQETDHRLLFEGITKFNAEIAEANQIPYLLRQCFRETTTGKPRPVHLDIVNHMGRTMEVAMVDEAFYTEDAYIKSPAFRPLAEKSKINEAITAIKKSKKPVIVAGRGAKVSGAEKEIYDFAILNDIPIATTPDGRAIVDEMNEIWAGNCGNYGMDCANLATVNSDLVIFIGTQASDQTTCDWTCPPIDTQIIQIDIDPAELGRCYPNTIGLLGDVKAVVLQLTEASDKTQRAEWRKEVMSYVQDTLARYKVSQENDNALIRPERLCHELSKVLPDDAVIVADTGYSAQWTITMLRLKATQKYFRAAGSLGWSFPGSMGIKLGLPDNPVICFAGDGAMYYHIGEMETMARYGIKTVTVVNNNQALAQCSGDIKQVHKDDEKRARSHYEFGPTRFSEIAKSFGLNGVIVEKPEDIGPAIIEALKADKSTVIDVITDPEANVPAPVMKKD